MTVEKKGRGRPKKLVTDLNLAVSPENENSSFDNSEMSENNNLNATEKKGRGRPKKSVISENTDLQQRLHEVSVQSGINQNGEKTIDLNKANLSSGVSTLENKDNLQQVQQKEIKVETVTPNPPPLKHPYIPSKRTPPEIGTIGMVHMEKIFKEIDSNRRIAPTLTVNPSTSSIATATAPVNAKVVNVKKSSVPVDQVERNNYLGFLIIAILLLTGTSIWFLNVTGQIKFDNLLNSIKSFNIMSQPVVFPSSAHISLDATHQDEVSKSVAPEAQPQEQKVDNAVSNTATSSPLNATSSQLNQTTVPASISAPANISSAPSANNQAQPSITEVTPVQPAPAMQTQAIEQQPVSNAPVQVGASVNGTVSTPSVGMPATVLPTSQNREAIKSSASVNVTEAVSKPAQASATTTLPSVNADFKDFKVMFDFGNITDAGEDQMTKVLQIAGDKKVYIYYFSKTLKDQNYQGNNLDVLYYESEILASHVAKELIAKGLKKENVVVLRSRSFALEPDFRKYYQNYGYALVRVANSH